MTATSTGRATGTRAGPVPGPDVLADLRDVTLPVDRLLDGVLSAALDRAESFGPAYVRLWSEIARSVRGGKRFRSAIVVRLHARLGGDQPEAAVSVGAGFEMLHTAFLVHDDLIDHDSVRRGEPNLAATMRGEALAAGNAAPLADRWSEAAAVLAGDLALSQAHRLIGGADLPVAQRDALRDLLEEVLLVSAGGELADTAFGLGLQEPTLEESMRVAESKTAMYSFRAPLRAGAIVAGASTAVQEELDDVGRLLGRAFQLVDDLLGVFAPESETGKSNLSDLREGKRTPLMIHARELPVWADLADHVGRPDLDQVTAARLRRALARSVAPAMVADAVSADLALVAARSSDGSLPAGAGHVVAAVAAQVERALRDVGRHVEEARCSTDRQTG
ncbi:MULTISPECIES: polyprenyl synthetase family protein [unclassified Actinotalea]|uniref:polyprenyl synthetase family protein n=1 Tax=unclassified Actinotalea TaxID=2638618 RepID=UPI0015F46818|nr:MULTISPECIES: polyprenyl synthetase family protein [unclassified Actinotalea]